MSQCSVNTLDVVIAMAVARLSKWVFLGLLSAIIIMLIGHDQVNEKMLSFLSVLTIFSLLTCVIYSKKASKN